MRTVMMMLSLLANLFDRETLFPAGILRVSLASGLVLYGTVRQTVGGLFEVDEEGILPPRRVKHLFPAHAIMEVRTLTDEEKAERVEQQRFVERPCAHCGKRDCRRKGQPSEHRHIKVPWTSETWCEVMSVWPADATVTPWKALHHPDLVTCKDCKEELGTWRDRYPGSFDAVSTRLFVGFANSGVDLRVAQGHTTSIDEAVEEMKAQGAVFDDAGIDLLIHGEPARVREAYGSFSGFGTLASVVRQIAGIEWREVA